MLNNFQISIILCTCGKHSYIAEVFRALNLQTFKNFQLILVDNNHIQSDFSEFFSEFNNFQVIYLSEPNLSAARNLGVKHASGKFILFLDDDSVPSFNWVEKIIEGFEKYNSDMVGGRVDLIIKNNIPRWFTNICRLYLSELVYYDKDIENIIPPRYVVGANMAFKAETFNKFGLFLKDAGRIGKKLISLEDVEMVRRIYNKGGKISYLNFAKVGHIIPNSRIKMSYLLKRAYWQGISDVLLENIHPLINKKNKKIFFDFNFLLEISRFLGKFIYNFKLLIKK